MEHKIMKLLEDGGKIFVTLERQSFLRSDTKNTIHKIKNSQIGLHQHKNFCSVKRLVRE